MIEVLKQMVEVLEYIDEGANNQGAHTGISWRDVSNKAQPAIQAGKQAIKELERQEPVAWKETDEVECPVCRDKGFPWPKCGHITYLERINPPQRKPLEVDKDGLFWLNKNECIHVDLIRKIEAAHGIKE